MKIFRTLLLTVFLLTAHTPATEQTEGQALAVVSKSDCAVCKARQHEGCRVSPAFTARANQCSWLESIHRAKQ